jgi:hypothetical protein
MYGPQTRPQKKLVTLCQAKVGHTSFILSFSVSCTFLTQILQQNRTYFREISLFCLLKQTNHRKRFSLQMLGHNNVANKNVILSIKSK